MSQNGGNGRAKGAGRLGRRIELLCVSTVQRSVAEARTRSGTFFEMVLALEGFCTETRESRGGAGRSGLGARGGGLGGRFCRPGQTRFFGSGAGRPRGGAFRERVIMIRRMEGLAERADGLERRGGQLGGDPGLSLRASAAVSSWFSGG